MSLCAYSVSGLINNSELALELERILLKLNFLKDLYKMLAPF